MENQEMIKKYKRGVGGTMIFGMMLVFLLIFAVPCSLLPSSYAAPLTDESTFDLGINKVPQAVDAGPTFIASIVKLFSGLAVVIGVLLLVYYFIREHLAKINKVPGKGRPINVLATHYLAPKKAVMLIEVAGERLVVGVGDEINLLARIENTEAGAYGHASARDTDFSDALKEASERESSTGLIDSIKDRLESLKGKR